MSVEMLETVKVKADNDVGYMIINKADLNEVQELYDADPVPATKLTKKEIAQQLKDGLTEEDTQTQASDLATKAPWAK